MTLTDDESYEFVYIFFVIVVMFCFPWISNLKVCSQSVLSHVTNSSSINNGILGFNALLFVWLYFFANLLLLCVWHFISVTFLVTVRVVLGTQVSLICNVIIYVNLIIDLIQTRKKLTSSLFFSLIYPWRWI